MVVAGAIAFDLIARSATALSDKPTAQLNVKLTGIAHAVGGCGANIAYNLAQLNCAHTLLSYYGDLDQAPLFEHCRATGIATRGLLRMPSSPSPRAIIVTDPDGHQFTGFYPGTEPSPQSWLQHLASQQIANAAVFVQAPLAATLMQAGLAHAREAAPDALRIWVPGQYAEILTPGEAADLFELAQLVIGNRHEIGQFGPLLAQPHERTVITTSGAGPINVDFADGSTARYEVEPASIHVDPTGCGDTFVAALASRMVALPSHTVSVQFDHAIAFAVRAAAECLQCAGAQAHDLGGLATV